ncbi:MAG TPA: cation:dicarboxylase symporter family transporter [Gemmatimonadaceae bacterium]|nr:cation:dicarboxylase symporter family transporter [Gemmatimonadaceae bacterium]
MRLRASLTAWSLAALAAGLAVGVAGHATGSSTIAALASSVRPLGDLWIAALQMTVLPLVVAHMLGAIVGVHDGQSVGALGGRALVSFVVMLAVAGLLTLSATPLLLSHYSVSPATMTALHSSVPVPPAAREAAAAPLSLAAWAATLLPRNLVQAALQGDILPLLLFTALFGVALTHLPPAQRDPLARAVHGIAAAMFIVVRWILWFTPPAVFALVLAFSLGSGGAAASVLGAFVALQSGLMLAATLLLYPASAALGGTSVRTFARAVAPAQLVAVSTRSSIAALPALIEGGRDHLQLPDTATGFVLPFSVSLFKVNRTISSTAKLIFLAHIYSIPLSAATLTTFLVTVIILSFSSAGVPGGGVAFKTLPAYLAAGVPIEGIVILEAVDTIPDVFKTLLNVTGDMSVATLLSRSARRVASASSITPETIPAAKAI